MDCYCVDHLRLLESGLWYAGSLLVRSSLPPVVPPTAVGIAGIFKSDAVRICNSGLDFCIPRNIAEADGGSGCAKLALHERRGMSSADTFLICMVAFFLAI